MVLKIFNDNSVYVYKDIDATFCQTRSYGGFMSLQFDMQFKHPLYRYIHEETRLEYDNQYYLIKGINERSKAGVATINAELDLSGLECKAYGEKTFSTRSFNSLCKEILKETGWTVVEANLVKRRTTTEATDKTPLEILQWTTNTSAYNACFHFDTKNKQIVCEKPHNETTSTGVYFTDELNLDELNFKGSTSELVTRLYVYGKDGLSIASVNDGKEYIENFSYTSTVISDVWRDERYTDVMELLNDGIVKLEALANPERSYTCKVINLAKTNPDVYAPHLNFDLYDVVTLIDRNRRTKIDHRIVEIKEYPANHALDVVTLSSVAAKITGKLTTLQSRVNELDAQQLHDRTKLNEIKRDIDTTVLHVSESYAGKEDESIITQTAQGLYFEVNNIYGTTKWGTALQQSSKDIMIAWNTTSDYIKFESVDGTGQINFYENPVTDEVTPQPILTIDKNGERVFSSSGSLLMSLSSDGQRYYYNNRLVGNIGGTYYLSKNNKYGLAFNLSSDAAYMAWSVDLPDPDEDNFTYNMKWAYLAPGETLGTFIGGDERNSDNSPIGMLNAGCSIHMHGHNIHNASLRNCDLINSRISGGVTYNKVFKIPTSIRSDGTVATWTNIRLKFEGGVFTGEEVAAN